MRLHGRLPDKIMREINPHFDNRKLSAEGAKETKSWDITKKKNVLQRAFFFKLNIDNSLRPIINRAYVITLIRPATDY